MPRRKPDDPPKPKGRPKSPIPRKTITLSVDQVAIDWIEKNMPRSVSISAFAREAIAREIERRQTAARRK
jgi:post-segregation antitoxin (ccd killing protein)